MGSSSRKRDSSRARRGRSVERPSQPKSRDRNRKSATSRSKCFLFVDWPSSAMECLMRGDLVACDSVCAFLDHVFQGTLRDQRVEDFTIKSGGVTLQCWWRLPGVTDSLI
jgi:hypothetical protein